jgi:hypothetical protein
VPLISELARNKGKKNKLERANPDIQVEWLEGQEGLGAMAFMWRSAADLMKATSEGDGLPFSDAAKSLYSGLTYYNGWINSNCKRSFWDRSCYENT